jgi:hypothetical protein
MAFGLLAIIVLGLPAASAGQTLVRLSDELRLFVDVNLAGPNSPHGGEREFDSRFVVSGEIGTARVRYPKPSGQTGPVLADVGGGIMLTRVLALGATYSRASYEERALLQTTIPHPEFFDFPSSGSGVSDEPLNRTEAATHVFVALVPVRTYRSQFRVLGGPSFFWLSADMVREVTYDQTATPAPQNTVVVTGVVSERVAGAGFGIHVGADYAHFLNDRIGIVGGLRYSTGKVSVDHEPLSGVAQEFRVGNRLIFLGVRLRFRR